MSSLQELLAQRDLLDSQIAQVRLVERAAAIAQVKQTLTEFDIAVGEVFQVKSKKNKSSSEKKPAPAKYRDPETGATWSGRGLTPKWMGGRERESFAI